jgi:hypothetical protein
MQSGSVVLRAFSAQGDDEDEGLDVIGAAAAALRSYRTGDVMGGDLSFFAPGSGVEWGPTEDGNWFMRGYRAAFEYRFAG